MNKPCNCSQQNKERSTLDNIRRLAEKIAKSESCIYAIIKREDGTFAFDPAEAVTTKGNVIEFVHYL